MFDIVRLFDEECQCLSIHLITTYPPDSRKRHYVTDNECFTFKFEIIIIVY